MYKNNSPLLFRDGRENDEMFWNLNKPQTQGANKEQKNNKNTQGADVFLIVIVRTAQAEKEEGQKRR